MARLPQVGGDEGNWGSILNDYLGQSHDTTGALKPGSVSAAQIQDNSITSNKLQAGVTGKSLLATNTPAEARNTIGAVSASGISNIIQITQAAYDTLTTKDSSTLYIIVE